MELLAKKSQKLKVIYYFAKSLILDSWQGSEYSSDVACKVKDVSFLNQFKFKYQK